MPKVDLGVQVHLNNAIISWQGPIFQAHNLNTLLVCIVKYKRVKYVPVQCSPRALGEITIMFLSSIHIYHLLQGHKAAILRFIVKDILMMS